DNDLSVSWKDDRTAIIKLRKRKSLAAIREAVFKIESVHTVQPLHKLESGLVEFSHPNFHVQPVANQTIPNDTYFNISGGPGHEGYFCEHAIGFNTYELVLNPSGSTAGPFVLELLSYPGGAVLYNQQVNLATGILPFTADVGTYTLRARGLHPCGPDDWKSELVQFVHCSEP
ncbi:MAG TPA: hypothetical protein VKZ78_01710, partial [Sphingobacteriaceae bacterium]|nr:hypothetical protein [Sphingobacteriaceae bacterium]